MTFQTFADSEELKNDGQTSSRLARIFHGTLEQYRAALLELNSQGAGVFVMINEGDGIRPEEYSGARVSAETRQRSARRQATVRRGAEFVFVRRQAA